MAAVQQVVREHGLGYRVEGETVAEPDAADPAGLVGEFFKDTTARPAAGGPLPAAGRTIVVRGSIDLAKGE